ncbi:MAG: hypothetical protein ABS76_21500 [Pelagibacterium sp. SCN 64-44]|nr:MAG: hypothetical protein ABS76_21500 [Pelagibacterium sp. SCN 64-44]
MEWLQHVPWSFVGWLIGAVVASIVWLIRLEARAGANKREIEITNEKVALVNSRVGATETLLAEVRATAITKTDLAQVEERVTKSVDNVGKQVTGEIDRFVKLLTSISGPKQ